MARAYLIVNLLHLRVCEVTLPGEAELVILVGLLLAEANALFAGHVWWVDVQQVLPECAA